MLTMANPVRTLLLCPLPQARIQTSLPVYMSALAQLPAINCGFSLVREEQIAILTANSETLTPMLPLIREECGLDAGDPKRFVIVGCQDVPGFEAVALGEKVNTKAVEPGIVAKVKKVLEEHPRVKCILMECTELPPYSDAVRAATGLPVYDAITACDYFMSGVQDNERFGMRNWQSEWNGRQADYAFAANLTEEERKALVNKPAGQV